MHDIRWIRENPEEFDRRLRRRPLSDEDRVRFSSQQLISIDERRRAIIRVNESSKALLNAASKEVGQAKMKGLEPAPELMAQIAEYKKSIATTEGEAKQVEDELNGVNGILAQIPNLPLDEVPDGADETGNIEHHHFGAKRNYAFDPKQHFELGEALKMMDFETAAKLSGSRFVVLNRGLARMERALGQFMLDVHTSEPHNYTEVSPPLMVRDEAMFGTAQLPKFEEDQFFALSALIPKEFEQLFEARLDQEEQLKALRAERARLVREFMDLYAGMIKPQIAANVSGLAERFLQSIFGAYQDDAVRLQRGAFEILEYQKAFSSRRWLIPTAEVSLTNLIRESILDEAELPLRFTACTPCFRAEAGAAGKDTRGMIRQHQFTKVELVSVTTPEQSLDEHERMLACAEEILRRLDLHYRVVTLCTGDMGFASQKTYDIEVWLPGQGAYREISSCSVCGDFQARRMAARYRPKEGKGVRHVHTLNGSGVAVGRALIAVMETYQQGNGAIAVPDVLKPYMGGMSVVGAE